MKRNMMIAGLVVFLLLAVPAQSLEIVPFKNVDGGTFYPFDFVDLGTALVNDEGSPIEVTVEQYIIYPRLPPMPLNEQFTIDPGDDVMPSDLSFSVLQYMTPGDYTHVVVVYRDGELLAEKTRVFRVAGTHNSFSEINVKVCADPACNDLRPVFVSGEKAYIKVECPENPSITGYIDYQDWTFTDLSFSGGLAEFRPPSAGTYTVNIILSKNGFSREIIEKEVTFLAEEPKSTYYFCSEVEDGICEDCPEGKDPDCGEISIGFAGFEYVITGIVILVIVLLMGLFFLKTRTGRV